MHIRQLYVRYHKKKQKPIIEPNQSQFNLIFDITSTFSSQKES